MNKKKKLDQNTIQTAKRLLKYMTGTHKIQFIIVFICIFISSAASIAVSLSLKFLLDDFIIPLIGQTDPNFAELYKALAVLGCIFALGVIATFIYTRMMVYIGQGVLKSVRDDMFEHLLGALPPYGMDHGRRAGQASLRRGQLRPAGRRGQRPVCRLQHQHP